MLPVIALVGRPNVGKSTLFNVLTRSRDALVANIAGVTRDRQYGRSQFEGREFIVIDTGGIADEGQVDDLIARQVEMAIEEAHLILFLVDGRAGINTGDYEIANLLRRQSKPVMVLVNKTDGLESSAAITDFYRLGFESVLPIAASHKRGTSAVVEQLFQRLPAYSGESEGQALAEFEKAAQPIKFAIIGRPNVGKSTLTNRILGEPRVMALDMPGTTTDSIYIPFERHNQNYVIVDTAGVRRRGKVKNTLEKFSVVKTLDAIEKVDVVIMLFDAREGITDQDLHLIGYSLEAGRAVIIAINKWDGLSEEHKRIVKEGLQRKLAFLMEFVEIFFISAHHGTGVGELFPAILRAYESSKLKVSPSQLTHILESAVFDHAPPVVNGRRIKLRYAHMGGQYPPVIVIHGSQTKNLPEDYKRYLINQFRKAFKIVGSPIRLELKSSENPFAGKRNTLTPRQQAKKKRLMKFVKKNKR